MKITLDCIIYGLQQFGGISTYWHGLVRYLSLTPEVELTLRLPRKYRIEIGALPLASSIPSIQSDALPPKLARYLPSPAGTSTDLVHTSYYRSPISSRTPSIVTVYDFTYEKFRRGVARLLHSTQKFSAIRRADGIICISENTRRDLLDRVAGVDPNRVVVIPLAVASEHFYPLAGSEVDRSLSDVVLFVGQRSGHKRFDLAIQALRAMADLRLGIAGPPLSKNEVASLDDALGKRWLAFSSVSSRELRVLYGSCFAFIYPSSYEGFGLPILEAMSCGVPVVVANLSSFPEVAGTAALYADAQAPEAYADRLQALFRSELREAKIGEGLVHARKFSWETTFVRTLELYRQVGSHRS